MDWVKQHTENLNLFFLWIYGPAGVGESVMAQTIAELCMCGGEFISCKFLFLLDCCLPGSDPHLAINPINSRNLWTHPCFTWMWPNHHFLSSSHADEGPDSWPFEHDIEGSFKLVPLVYYHWQPGWMCRPPITGEYPQVPCSIHSTAIYPISFLYCQLTRIGNSKHLQLRYPMSDHPYPSTQAWIPIQWGYSIFPYIWISGTSFKMTTPSTILATQGGYW